MWELWSYLDVAIAKKLQTLLLKYSTFANLSVKSGVTCCFAGTIHQNSTKMHT